MDDMSSTPVTGATLSRKDLLRRGGAGAGAVAIAAAVPAVPALARSVAPAIIKARPTVSLGYGGATCEAPLYVAYNKGFFAAEGLNVELVRLGNGYNTNDALSTGKLHGAPGILFTYLKPIEQGADIKLTAGLHGNCLRLVIAKNSGITKATDFKGKTIATDSFGGSAMAFFSLLLAKNGVDPIHDVSWKVYPPTLLGEAFKKGEAQAAAAPDPFAFFLIRDGQATQVGNNILGLYGNKAGITTHRYCCTVGLSGKLVHDQPKVAAAVTRAWMRGSRWAGAHTAETAQIETSKKYVPLDAVSIKRLLDSYLWNPSSTLVKEDIYVGARNFKVTGYLDPNTDPNKLAQQTYVDIFALAGEPYPN